MRVAFLPLSGPAEQLPLIQPRLTFTYSYVRTYLLLGQCVNFCFSHTKQVSRKPWTVTPDLTSMKTYIERMCWSHRSATMVDRCQIAMMDGKADTDKISGINK